MAKTVDVVAGQKIASAWGNEIRDRTIQSFATVAERDASGWVAPNGAFCVTIDTATLWQRVGGAWVSRRPFVLGGTIAATTDGFGNLSIVLPAGAHWRGATANGAQTGFPSLVIINATDGPVGGGNLFFNVRHPDGTPWTSAVLSIGYVVVYDT